MLQMNWEDLNSKVVAEQMNQKPPEKKMQEIEMILDQTVEIGVEGEGSAENTMEQGDITKELEGVAKIKISAEEQEQEQPQSQHMQPAQELELDEIL